MYIANTFIDVIRLHSQVHTEKSTEVDQSFTLIFLPNGRSINRGSIPIRPALVSKIKSSPLFSKLQQIIFELHITNNSGREFSLRVESFK